MAFGNAVCEYVYDSMFEVDIRASGLEAREGRSRRDWLEPVSPRAGIVRLRCAQMRLYHRPNVKTG
jgi:hypothetical protein